MIERIHVTRRGLVRAMLLAGGLTHAIRSAGAISRRPIQAGVQKFQGDFKLNNRPARLGQIVNPGDMATTGHGSSAIIIIGQHAFMLRENTTIEFYPVHFENDDGVVSGVLKMVTGALLSVFGKPTDTEIQTSAVTIGIRGTGCYVDARPERTYACVCYGRADLTSAATGRLLETLNTTRHDQPRYIYPPGAPIVITPAPLIDHGDAELRLLESIVGRTPPFDDGTGPRTSPY